MECQAAWRDCVRTGGGMQRGTFGHFVNELPNVITYDASDALSMYFLLIGSDQKCTTIVRAEEYPLRLYSLHCRS